MFAQFTRQLLPVPNKLRSCLTLTELCRSGTFMGLVIAQHSSETHAVQHGRGGKRRREADKLAAIRKGGGDREGVAEGGQ